MHRRCSRASLLPHRSRSLVLLRSFIAAEHRDCTPIMLVHCFLFFFPLSLSLYLMEHGRASQSLLQRDCLLYYVPTTIGQCVQIVLCVISKRQKLAYLLHAYSTRTRRYFFFCHLFSSSDVMRCEFLGG